MPVIQIVAVDDNTPSAIDAACDAIKAIFRDKSGGDISWDVYVTSHQVDGQNRVHEAAKVKAGKPDIVLCDWYMPNRDDGPAFLHTLCCEAGYTGFIYVWSSSRSEDVRDACRRFKPLFEEVGGAGFHHGETDRLAHRVWEDYVHCGNSFAVPQPENRCFHPLNEALEILHDFQSLLWEPESPDREAALAAAALRRLGTDGCDPDGFRYRVTSRYQPTHNRVLALSDNVREIGLDIKYARRGLSESVTALRDALLDLCAECGYR